MAGVGGPANTGAAPLNKRAAFPQSTRSLPAKTH